MDFLTIIDNLTNYGVDIATISAITCVIVQILKRTLLKNCPKKVISFLPFAIGTILYAVFAAVAHLDIGYLLTDLPYVCERGFTIGALSTVLYVLYEQLIREREQTGVTEGVIAALIEGYVTQEGAADAAKRIAEALKDDLNGDGAKLAADILKEYAAEDTDQIEIEAVSKVIVDTLKSLTGQSAQ